MLHRHAWMALALFGLLSQPLAALASAGGHPDQASKGKHAGKEQDARVIPMTVSSEGFVPAVVKLAKGEPVRLVITRTTDKTCATEIVVEALHVRKALPLGVPVEISFTPANAGNLRYACGMDMVSGVLQVE